MNKYEAIVVFPPTLTEAEMKDELKRVVGVLETNGASEISVESWGKKEIAYFVRGHKTGVYNNLTFTLAEGRNVETIVGTFRLMERIIKFQVHRLNVSVRKFKGNPRRTSSESDLGGVEADF
jgi:ribosomal protein S6